MVCPAILLGSSILPLISRDSLEIVQEMLQSLYRNQRPCSPIAFDPSGSHPSSCPSIGEEMAGHSLILVWPVTASLAVPVVVALPHDSRDSASY